MRRFCFYEKDEEELNVITSVLDMEGMKYRVQSKETSMITWTGLESNYKYDIIIDTFYEYYLYLKEKVEKALTMVSSFRSQELASDGAKSEVVQLEPPKWEALPIVEEGNVITFTLEDINEHKHKE